MSMTKLLPEQDRCVSYVLGWGTSITIPRHGQGLILRYGSQLVGWWSPDGVPTIVSVNGASTYNVSLAYDATTITITFDSPGAALVICAAADRV